MDKPWSAASERNREAILAVLRRHFADRRHVLEIGSGTGQHAVHFAAALAHLDWQPSDRAENLSGIAAWIADTDASARRPLPPLALDVTDAQWPAGDYDAVFSANTLHIMAWDEVQALFAGVERLRRRSDDFKLAVYGPFNYGGRHTSASNAQFDASLRAQAPWRGIRDFEAVDALAREAGLALAEDAAMPANNRCLVWASA